MNYTIDLKIILFVCFLLLATGVGGLCQVEKTQSNSVKTTTTTADVITTSSDPAEVLQKAVKNWLNARSFRARAFVITPKEEANFEVEFVGPNRIRSVVSDPKGKMGRDMISIGSIRYTREWGEAVAKLKPDAKWEKSKTSFIDEIIDPRSGFLSSELFGRGLFHSEIKVVGPETVNGIPTMVYQSGTGKIIYSQERGGPLIERLTHKIKIWVGVRDNLPYKVEVEKDESVPPIGDDAPSLTLLKKFTISFSDYSADIKIEPPI
jgi:hypothetical protein